MDIINIILFGIAAIILFGFLAEFIFKKLGVPDVLLLVFLGFIIGPNMLGFVSPNSFAQFAPVFTTFALMFLMFEGSLNIDLASFTKGLLSGSTISLYNFLLSVTTICSVLMFFFKFEFFIALMLGCVLGGVSSAFVIPILKQLNLKGEVYTILTLESALTDVYTIVFSLTILQIIKIQEASAQVVLNQVASLFAIAALIGFFAAMMWIFLDEKIFKGAKNYMSIIAYLILLYIITTYLGGNGAIASMFFGIFLKNSKELTKILAWIKTKDAKEKVKIMGEDLGISVISPTEELFFGQISFFLKTFFFVYIGILINLSDTRAIIIGLTLAAIIMLVRRASLLLTKEMRSHDRQLINSIFARGLAAAAVLQIIIQSGVIKDTQIVDITYIFIVATILLSSVNIFYYMYTQQRAAGTEKSI